MISREFARDQIMRLFVLRDPPREDAGIAEMIDTLQRAGRDEPHARAIVDAAVREREYFPRPCDIYEIAGSTSPARYWESSAEVVRARRAQRDAAIQAVLAERPELGLTHRRIGRWRWMMTALISDVDLLEETFPGGRPTPSEKHHEWDELFIRVQPADKERK